MQNKSEAIKLGYLLGILLRRRWFIIIPFCLSMITGIYFALTLPKIYSSSTLILIQPQRVPADYVRSIVSVGVEARISTISQLIMSRTNLEKIIEQFNLFSGPEYENIFMEDRLAILRNSISVNVTTTRRDTDSFSITVKGKNPENIAKIANTLASFFIDENLRLRETQAVGTSDFLENELQIMTKRLEEREEILKEYNQKYMGGLPEQLETNLRILDRLQELLSEQRSSLSVAKNRLVEFENRIPPEIQSFPLTSGANQTEYLSNIDQMKEMLASLKTKYTDRHPDVIRLNKIINEFDSKNKNKSEGEGTEDLETSGNSISYSDTYTRQREGIKTEIKTLEEDITKVSNNLRYYEKLVEDTPKREQELLSLRRDYQNIQGAYNSLLNRKLEAEISVNMEKKQKGEQFRIVDSARVSEKPISPDMKKLLLLAIAAGIAIGGGIIYLLEFLDSSFRDRKDVETFLGLSVIATVPVLNNPKIDIKHKLNNIFSILSILLSFFLLGGLALLTFYGVEQTIEVIKNLR